MSASSRPRITPSKRHLFDLTDCLSYSIGFLRLAEIFTHKRISKEFKKRCIEALKNVQIFSDKIDVNTETLAVSYPTLFLFLEWLQSVNANP